MWSRVAQIALRAHIQHRRVRDAAVAMLCVRLFEGAACWAILHFFFAGTTVPVWAVDLNFASYGVANFALFFAHRREAITRSMVWLDIVVNMVPMAVAAHWSGGIYSPLLPVFVIKIGNYGLIYGVDVGLQSLITAAAAAAALALLERAGFGPHETIDLVPFLVRQRLTLAFAGLIFAIGCGGALRVFRILQDRDARLAESSDEQNRLYQESLDHQERLRHLSRRMMEVTELTTSRLSRELHDVLGQALTAVKMELGAVDRELPADSPLRPRIREAREHIGTVLQSVRNLSQLLHPAVLDDLGLVPAMQSYLTSFEKRTSIAVTLEAPIPDTRVPRPLEIAFYRVLQEALTNVARHAQARHVAVRFDVTGVAANLSIADDGCGFDTAAMLNHPPAEHGMGMIGMRERVATYGGEFLVDSAPGHGTRVQLSIPLTAASEALSDESYGEHSRLAG